MRVNNMLVSCVLFVFFAAATAHAIEISEDLKTALLKMIEKATKVDVVMDREDIRKEVLHSALITASMRVSADRLLDEYRDGKLTFLEILMTPPSGDVQMPVVEKTLCFLFLKDIALLQGDKNKAKKYVNMAEKNAQDGINYYSKIGQKGSIIAMYNLYMYNEILKAFAPSFAAPIGQKDIENAKRIISESDYLRERSLALENAITQWNKNISKIPKKP